MMYVRLLLLPSDSEREDHHGNCKKPLDKKVILSAVSMIQKRGALVQMLKANVDKVNMFRNV